MAIFQDVITGFRHTLWGDDEAGRRPLLPGFPDSRWLGIFGRNRTGKPPATAQMERDSIVMEIHHSRKREAPHEDEENTHERNHSAKTTAGEREIKPSEPTPSPTFRGTALSPALRHDSGARGIGSVTASKPAGRNQNVVFLNPDIFRGKPRPANATSSAAAGSFSAGQHSNVLSLTPIRQEREREKHHGHPGSWSARIAAERGQLLLPSIQPDPAHITLRPIPLPERKRVLEVEPSKTRRMTWVEFVEMSRGFRGAPSLPPFPGRAR